GANFDAGGTLKQPNYSEALGLEEAGRIKDGVEAGFQYVGKTLGEHDLRIEQNQTDIANITQGTAGLVKLDRDRIVIDNRLPGVTAATLFDIANIDQKGESVARHLTGVAEGEISKHSTDAINGSQLYQTNETVKNIDQRVINHENKMTNIDQRVTENGAKIIHLGDRVTVNEEDIKHIGDQITRITESTGKQLTGIETAFGAGANFDAGGTLKQPNYSEALGLEEAGRIKDGVEAGFQYVGKTLGEHDLRIEQNHTDIANITQGTAGLVKLDHNRIVIDNRLPGVTAATLFDIANIDQKGESVARHLTGVAEGEISKHSTDAINGSQLYQTNEKVEDIDQRVINHENKMTNIDQRVTENGDKIIHLGDRVTVNEEDIKHIGDQITGIIESTGKQLTGIETAFGAGAKFDAGGTLKQPNYSEALGLEEAGRIKDGVEAGFQYVGKTLGEHDLRIEQNQTDIANITQGTAGLVKLDRDRIVIDNLLPGVTAATLFDIANIDQNGQLVARHLMGVAEGEISEHSTDAINGSQLHQTNEKVEDIDQRVINHERKITNIDRRVTDNGDKIINLGDRIIVNEEGIKNIGDQITGIIESTGKQLTGIETAFGAGANFDAGGTLKQPNYSEALGLEEAGRIKDGVEAGFQYVGKTLGEHDLRIEQNHTDIANITQGTAGLVKLDHNRIVIDNLLAKDAMIFDFSNSHKDRTVTGIAAGSIAQDSSDAVNGAQLFETQQRIENISTVNQQNLEGIADAFGGGAHVENGVLKGVDFTDSLAADRPIKSVNDGFSYVTERLDDHENRLDQHSTKLENHENRLDQHNTKLENHENRLTNIESNISNITEGKAGLIQLSEDRKTLVMDNHLGQDADTFDISNSADGRTLTGVNSGQVKENSKDAINGGQLYASNQSIAEIFGGGATIDKEGYVSTPEYRFGDEAIFNNVGDSLTYLNNKIQEHGIFSLDRDKNQIIIAENQDINRETVVNIGDRKIVGVANGLVEKGSQDAINGSQLWKTNQQVAANSNQIKHINNTLNHYNNRLSHLEQSVQQNRKVASAGISSAIAMSAIPYSSSGKHSFGMGVGSYDGEAAVSMGVIFNLSHDARFKIQGSYDTQNRAGVGVGFAIDF
ncbi:YadA-like family protein, partial [Ignatzschineria cameli]|uniref:YadA-like family protein n=1 Tax=Ignatzschineria cameli TaxID=2182793 RepID=UPI000D6184EE